MRYDIDTIYSLLPAFHRIKDYGEGEPLKEFLSLVTEQLEALEEDIDQSYDNLFIETCAEWVVPYIGDLVAYRLIHGSEGSMRSSRAEVANTIRFRRRKGTVVVLEELARNLTGLDAAAVEFFRRIATNEHLNHLRLGRQSTVDLRQMEPLERLGTAFDHLPHTVDIRRVASGRGKYNIPNVGIFLWRLAQQRWSTVRAQPAADGDQRRFLFHPLGTNTQLYTLPEPESDIAHLAEPANVPLPLSRRELRRRLEFHYGIGQAFSIFRQTGPGSELEEIPPSDIESCYLGDLDPANPDSSDWPMGEPSRVNVDPELGRIRFPDDQSEVYVMFHYAFSARIGGGEYGRVETFSTQADPFATFPESATPTLQSAIDSNLGEGVVEINGSGPFFETPRIHCAADSRMEIRSADQSRATLRLNGDLVVTGGSSSELTLNGLLLAGGRIVVPAEVDGEPNQLQRLRIVHCTIVPGISLHRNNDPTQPTSPSIVIDCPDTEVDISWSITGGVRAIAGAVARAEHSIIDATDEAGVAFAALDEVGPGAPLSLRSCTVIGKIHSRTLVLVSNSVLQSATSEGDGWDGPVVASRRQSGCVRFSYVPPDSLVPRRYRCLPTPGTPSSEAPRPQFASTRFSHPAYAQLADHSSPVFLFAADDGGEIGAFNHLQHSQRLNDVKTRLDEYLRFGLEAGIFHSS